MKGSILLVDYNDYAIDFKFWLEKGGYFVMLYKSEREAIDDVRGGLRYDMALFHLTVMKNLEPFEIVRISREHNPNAPIITYSGMPFRPAGVNFHFKRPRDGEGLIEIVNEHFPRNLTHEIGVEK